MLMYFPLAFILYVYVFVFSINIYSVCLSVCIFHKQLYFMFMCLYLQVRSRTVAH